MSDRERQASRDKKRARKRVSRGLSKLADRLWGQAGFVENDVARVRRLEAQLGIIIPSPARPNFSELFDRLSKEMEVVSRGEVLQEVKQWLAKCGNESVRRFGGG